MRTLFIAHRIPFPPDKGDKIRSFHEVQALSAAGHEVHLLAFADDPRDLRADYRDALTKIAASVSILPLNRRAAAARALASLVRGAPFTLGYFSSGRMRAAVANAIASARPEAIVAYSSSVVQYVPASLYSRTLLDMVDVDSEKWRDYSRMTSYPRSWVYRTEARRLGSYERTVIRRVARTIVTTPREASTLLGGTPDEHVRGRVEAVANGVDLERFAVDGKWEPVALAGKGPLVVFTGAMDYYANVDAARHFAHDVWPRIRERVPDAQFVVVGSRPTAAVRSLASVPGITVTGTVPDVRPYIAAAAACVAPMRIARGVQNKILEAMAMGRAVVTTPAAAAALTATPGQDLIVADGEDALADAVVSIIADRDRRRGIEQRARLFVERAHDWAVTLRPFLAAVEAVAAD